MAVKELNEVSVKLRMERGVGECDGDGASFIFRAAMVLANRKVDAKRCDAMRTRWSRGRAWTFC